MIPNPLQWEGLNLEAPKAMYGDHTSRNRPAPNGRDIFGGGDFC